MATRNWWDRLPPVWCSFASFIFYPILGISRQTSSWPDSMIASSSSPATQSWEMVSKKTTQHVNVYRLLHALPTSGSCTVLNTLHFVVSLLDHIFQFIFLAKKHIVTKEDLMYRHPWEYAVILIAFKFYWQKCAHSLGLSQKEAIAWHLLHISMAVSNFNIAHILESVDAKLVFWMEHVTIEACWLSLKV